MLLDAFLHLLIPILAWIAISTIAAFPIAWLLKRAGRNLIDIDPPYGE